MNILQFEKYIDHKIFDLIFNNLELNENAGHPLFNDESSDIGIEFINKIKNALEIVNNKLYTTRPNSTIYDAKFNNKILKARKYEFTILIDKLEFKNIIYSPGAKLKLIVYDILNSDKLTNDDYDILYQASSGCLHWNTRDSINKRKFKTLNDKMEITCYAINGKITPHSFLPIFLHEYLHFYENYNRVKTSKHIDFIKNLKNHKNIYNNANLSKYLQDEEIHALKRLLYVLFYGEDNARIGTLFGHLISYDIKTLKEFHDNKKHIFYFTEYERLKKYLNIIKNIDADIIFYIFDKGNFFRDKNKLSKDISLMSSTKVKKLFINIIESKLNKFYERGMKFVERYINMLNNYKDKNFINRYSLDEDYNKDVVKKIIF